jgi:hypothetical protein
MALTGKRQAVALELVKGLSPDLAAVASGVSPRTVYRWKNEPEFVVELKALRDQIRSDSINGTIDRLTRMLGPAVAAHVKLLKTENERVRLAAIFGVYEWQQKMFEQHVLAAEVAELKRIVAGMKRSQGRRRDLDPLRNGSLDL